jgi:hypothetical protein
MTKRAIEFTDAAFIAELSRPRTPAEEYELEARVMAAIDAACARMGVGRNEYFKRVMGDIRSGNFGNTFVGEPLQPKH